MGDFSERLGVFKAGLADGGDDLVTHGDGADLLLSGFGGLHGVFEAIEEAEVAAVAAAGGDDGRSSRGGLIGHHLFQNFNDNAFHVLLAHVHIYTPMLEAGPRGTLRTARAGGLFFLFVTLVRRRGRAENRGLPVGGEPPAGAIPPDSCDK